MDPQVEGQEEDDQNEEADPEKELQDSSSG